MDFVSGGYHDASLVVSTLLVTDSPTFHSLNSTLIALFSALFFKISTTNVEILSRMVQT
jgi:hypothetical protein